MPDAVLMFTFSPVQSFIAEARRAADLYAGSRILVALARAAAEAVQRAGGSPVYPAELDADVPNKLVAIVPWERARTAAEAAEAALWEQWREIAASARARLGGLSPRPDTAWSEIWERQVGTLWEVYWAAARMDGDGDAAYRAAYHDAGRGLDAAKRTRAFAQAEEHGLKDSLSGRREALHPDGLDSKAYWKAVGARVTAAKLRPDGRERLDAIGAVKRFSDLAEQQSFLSTSSVASADFLARARARARTELSGYRAAVEAALGAHAYRVRPDADWPYDGDLFYLETLRPASLEDRYGLRGITEAALEPTRRELRALHRAAGGPPSPYYGIVVLDGDSMGQRVTDCLKEANPREAHQELSRRLAKFADAVSALFSQHQAQPIYNGGDDVLALAPLATALPFARALAARFHEITGGTASAGIALAHHLSPLDAALRAARNAEQGAKASREEKNAVCLTVIKRSGETIEVRSPWEALGDRFERLVQLLRDEALAGRFVADVAVSVSALPEADDLLRAELRRLLRRHRSPTHLDAPDPDTWADQFAEWARALPAGEGGYGRAAELARWVGAAAFVARGGGE